MLWKNSKRSSFLVSENYRKIQVWRDFHRGLFNFLLKVGLASRQGCSQVLKKSRDEDGTTSQGPSYSHIPFLMWKSFFFCPNGISLIAAFPCCLLSSRLNTSFFFAIHPYKLQELSLKCLYIFCSSVYLLHTFPDSTWRGSHENCKLLALLLSPWLVGFLAGRIR